MDSMRSSLVNSVFILSKKNDITGSQLGVIRTRRDSSGSVRMCVRIQGIMGSKVERLREIRVSICIAATEGYIYRQHLTVSISESKHSPVVAC